MAFEKNLNKLSKLLTTMDDEPAAQDPKDRKFRGQVMMDLSEITSLFDGVVTQEDMEKVVMALVAQIKIIKEELESKTDTSRSEILSVLQGLQSDVVLLSEQLKMFDEDSTTSNTEHTTARLDLEARYEAVQERIEEAQERLMALNQDEWEARTMAKLDQRVAESTKPLTAQQVSDLVNEAKLPVTAIRDWDVIESGWTRAISLAATAQIEVLSAGVKMGSSHRLNFGSGATVSMENGTITLEVNGLPTQTGNNGKFLTTNGTTASWAVLAGGGDLLAANNLSDLANAGTARTNLGLGGAATLNVGTTAGTVAAGDHNHTGVYAPALGADDNYVTDAEKTKLSNLSGTNTGDQDLSTLAPKASPTFTGTVTLPVGLTGVIRADTGVVSVDTDVTDLVAAGTNLAAGKLELATDAETVTGSDTARATTPANITAKMSAPGAIGNTTPSTGKFTSVETTGAIELGHASDTTIARSGAGAITVEGVQVVLANTSPTLATITTTGNIELGHASDTTLSRSAAGVLAVEGVVIPSISSTNTLTNKRVTRRVTTTNAPGATPTTNTDNVDVMNFTGLNTAITSMTTNLSGTPVDGDLIMFRFTDDGTARAITWGASFAATTVALPTTTVISTMLRVGFQYSGSTWKCIATA